MTPTLCSGVADSQLWTLGIVAERLPKMRNAWFEIPVDGLITDPVRVTVGAPTRKSVLPSKFMSPRAAEAKPTPWAWTFPVSRMPSPGSVVWLPCVWAPVVELKKVSAMKGS